MVKVFMVCGGRLRDSGAESQLMSLWKVNDEETKELMIKYYQRLLQNHGCSEALRQTQLEMLNSEEYQHPYYWAAFVPVGDWTPLEDSMRRGNHVFRIRIFCL